MPTSPEVTDYPPLLEWLNKHDARCVWFISDWETGRKNPSRHVEAWMLRGGAIVLIELRADKRGWNLYTAPNTNDIPQTFADAEQRCQIGVYSRTADHPDPITNAAELAAIGRVQVPRDKFGQWASDKSAIEVRDAIIQQAGMMASARTPEMQAAYDAALAREGKVDSPDGPCNVGRVSFTEQREDRREAVRKAIEGRVVLDGPLSNKTLDEIISAVLHG